MPNSRDYLMGRTLRRGCVYDCSTCKYMRQHGFLSYLNASLKLRRTKVDAWRGWSRLLKLQRDHAVAFGPCAQ